MARGESPTIQLPYMKAKHGNWYIRTHKYHFSDFMSVGGGENKYTGKQETFFRHLGQDKNWDSKTYYFIIHLASMRNSYP